MSDIDLTLCVWGLTFEKGELLSSSFFVRRAWHRPLFNYGK